MANEQDERHRQEQVKELMEFCEEILDSRIPSSAPLDIKTLPDTARRLLASSGTGHGRDVTGDKALRFSAAWSKLEKGVSDREWQPVGSRASH